MRKKLSSGLGYGILLGCLSLGCSNGTSPGDSGNTSSEAAMQADSKQVDSGVAAIATPTRSSSTVYLDIFDDANDGEIKFDDGKWTLTDQPYLRRVFPFYDRTKTGLTLRTSVSRKQLGPDKKPGVLAFVWEAIPEKLGYSGFAYLGSITENQDLRLPEIAAVTSKDDLSRFQIKFRYRGFNANAIDDPFNIQCAFRIEPVVDDPYKFRLDMHSFEVTEHWQEFDMELGFAGNIQPFLECLLNQPNQYFKFVWAQSGGIESYKPGTTLLIDHLHLLRTPISK